MKKLITLIIMLILFSTVNIFAKDNADSGNGDTNNALKGKAFYRSSEYMYKVSIYVGLSDDTDMNDSINKFKRIGNQPTYIKPSNFTIPRNTYGTPNNKIDYIQGASLSPVTINEVITGNVPPIPITNGGNINSVKSYFGDTRTLIGIIDDIAEKQGTTREGLVQNISFTINGKKGLVPPEEILPVKSNGKYQNKVAWLIIYEPVTITYTKPNSKGYRQPIAFTATEYALSQKLGYFNWFWGKTGQYVAGMTHCDLPNSIVLEESWIGIPVTKPLADGVYWSDDRIISGGGIGMRMLEPNGSDTKENDTTYDYTYRVNTEVITSVIVEATNGDITPDKRHNEIDTRKNSYTYPSDNKAYVTITANGQSTTVPIVIPSGNSQYAWLKWRTPSKLCEVTVDVSISGNSSARLKDGRRNESFKVKIESLSENEPPDPRPTDTMPNFEIPELPNQADKTSAQWGIYSAVWGADYRWHEDWKKYHSGCYTRTNKDGSTTRVHRYKWVDEGYWEDYGEWVYTFTQYTASINVTMELVPDSHNPSSKERYGEYIIASGYGVDIKIDAGIATNAPSSHYTKAQNVVTYFPEYSYNMYWRLLEKIGINKFEFKKNIFSTFNSRTHFTPLPYPNGKYEIYANVIDCWTPDGMLRVNLSDKVMIEGNVYDDWHIAPSSIN
ncbi:hypothetical protein [Vallitalea guaymasensis]|uniref:Uncharacterized protein n=1 Tax=Vallitalea guaymasensis TaxID=1185412 RepID=A0A8J8ME26_9FIRM|nr:hypothetical protein [Vallitalea guaymasensis]QUH31129.1 hypothetical protein HYG85_20270 [Vallitalea guaymasensis]